MVFPAPAGINQDAARRELARLRVPRASGDKPAGVQALISSTECSPRQRG